MKKVKIFFTALLVLVTSAAFAQNITITGTVKDSSTGDAIPAASVLVKSSKITNGVATDVDGKFSITVPANSVLVFSSIGYETKEEAVSGKKKYGHLS